jgi:hypothetical protein
MSVDLYTLEKMRQLPTGEILKRVRSRVRLHWTLWMERKRGRANPTELTDDQLWEAMGMDSREEGLGVLRQWLRGGQGIAAGTFEPGIFTQQAIEQANAETLAHRFDLLGSGLVKVGYETVCMGFEGHSYARPPDVTTNREPREQIAEALELNRVGGEPALRQALENYEPIDWHLDFRSGYRWDPACWYMDVPVGKFPGVDIKVPWELSRFQHLPRLAWAYSNGRASDKEALECLLQMMDWIVANPYRFGCNWRIAMEVGIRVANWLLTLDFLRDCPLLTDAFLVQVAKSLFQHGQYIIDHLEYNEVVGGNNHYVANIVGLIFIGACCPWIKHSDGWLAFGLQELVGEMWKQVRVDGGHFEGSTHYHRLVAEMFLYGTIRGLRLPSERFGALSEIDAGELPRLRKNGERGYDEKNELIFPAWYWERLRAMARWTKILTKPDGLVPQFGDNDNGRFLALTPLAPIRVTGCPHSFSDHRSMVALAGVFLDQEDLLIGTEDFIAEAFLFVGENSIPLDLEQGNEQSGDFLLLKKSQIAVYQEPGIFLAVCCRPTEHGHCHNDLFSFDLQIFGWDVVIDPGSYCYTADPLWRNHFRSTGVHNTLSVPGQEQNPFGEKDIIAILNRAQPQILRCMEGMLEVVHNGFGQSHWRTFEIGKRCLQIADKYRGESWCHLNLAPDVFWKGDAEGGMLIGKKGEVSVKLNGFEHIREEEGFHSPAYGSRLPNRTLDLYRGTEITLIEFRW